MFATNALLVDVLIVDIFDVNPLSVERLITDTFKGSVTPPPVEFIVVTPPEVDKVMFVPAARLFAMFPVIKSLLKTDAFKTATLLVEALRVDTFNGSLTLPPAELIVVTPPLVLNVMFVPAAKLFAMFPVIKSLLKTDAFKTAILPVEALRVDMFDVVEFKNSVVIRDELMFPILPVLTFAVDALRASFAILTEKFPP